MHSLLVHMPTPSASDWDSVRRGTRLSIQRRTTSTGLPCRWEPRVVCGHTTRLRCIDAGCAATQVRITYGASFGYGVMATEHSPTPRCCWRVRTSEESLTCARFAERRTSRYPP